MKNSSIKICTEVIYPGEKLSLALPLPQLFSCAPLYMPIKIIHGKQAGPCFLVLAAMYGDEINGTEIINRLINLPFLSKLRGTLIAIPVVNVYGMLNRARYLPGDIDLNQCFPGSEHGAHDARFAHSFVTEIFSKANYCINLKTGPINQSHLPQIHTDITNPTNRELAKVFNAPVILNTTNIHGSLQQMAAQNNIPFLTYEAGEALRFDEHAIKVGLRGIINVMKKSGMLPDTHTKKEKLSKSFFAEGNLSVCAPTAGINHSKVKLGQYLKCGDIVSTINDPFGTNDAAVLRNPQEGIVVGKNNLPLVHEGTNLFQIAVFSQIAQAASYLEEWKEKNIKELDHLGVE